MGKRAGLVQGIGSALVWIAVSACAGSRAPEHVALPELAACASKWSTLLPLQGKSGEAPSLLRWQDGFLYYNQGLTDDQGVFVRPRIMALSDLGGTPIPVIEDIAFDAFWVEGDRVLYAAGDQLYSVPDIGGTPSLVADGQMWGIDARLAKDLGVMADTLDGAFLYFALSQDEGTGKQEWTIWRTPRAGGASEQLATMRDKSGLLLAIVPLSNALLLAPQSLQAFTVPSDGGRVHALPSVEGGIPTFAGADQSGVLWNLERADGHGKILNDLILSKPSGAPPAIFWPTKPPDMSVGKAWSDRTGHWIISGLETFSDGLQHMSVWSIDREGHDVRLACDRKGQVMTGYPAAAALSPDAVYLVVTELGQAISELAPAPGDNPDGGPLQDGWKLMKIPR